MSSVEKTPRRTSVRRKTSASAPPAAPGSVQARRQAAAILEVLAGVRRPSEAAQALETSLPRYYLLERRALAPVPKSQHKRRAKRRRRISPTPSAASQSDRVAE